MNFTARVVNQGDVAASNPEVRFYIDGALLSTSVLSGALTPGESRNVSTLVPWVYADCLHRVTAIVDESGSD